MPLPWIKTEFEFLEKILWIFQVSSKVLNIDIDVTEFSLIDLLSALLTVTSDSFVVENYQVPFLRSKMRLKKTLIKVAYKASITKGFKSRGRPRRGKTTTINCCVTVVSHVSHVS